MAKTTKEKETSTTAAPSVTLHQLNLEQRELDRQIREQRLGNVAVPAQSADVAELQKAHKKELEDAQKASEEALKAKDAEIAELTAKLAAAEKPAETK